MVNVSVTLGNIAQVPADALITAVNSGGMWFGGIDGVIGRVAGRQFHAQIHEHGPHHQGQAIVAKRQVEHEGSFDHVIFVIDDLEGPLSNVIYNGLTAAHGANYKSVTLPTIRMGVMLGAVEKSTGEAVEQMADAISRFVADNPDTSLVDIKFVVYGDTEVEEKLRAALASH